jgi:seryl-tRNA synthetase
MKQSQINRLEMIQTTNNHLNQHTAVWNTIPIVGKSKNQLAQLMSDIKKTAKDQEEAQVFIGASLREIKKTIATKIDIIDDAIESFAEDTENAELHFKSKNTASDYFKLPNEDFETKTLNMIKLSEETLPAMNGYGATQEEIDDVKILLNNFLEKRQKPRAFKVASKVATLSLEDQFKKTGSVNETV